MNLQHISYAEPEDPFVKRRLIRFVEFITGRPGFIRRYAATYVDWLERVYGKSDRVWFDALQRLGIDTRLHGVPWPPKVAKDAPVILIANDPYGVLDVDFTGTREAQVTNLNTRREALERLKRGETIIVFPAGGVSTARSPFGKADDLPWGPFTARLIHGSQATVVPIFFEGQNSPLFHLGSRIGLSYRLSLLAGEFFRRCGQPLDIHIGAPIPYDVMEPLRDRQALMDYSLPHRGPTNYRDRAA